MKKYIKTVLKKGLGIKKGQHLFISIPKECMYLNLEILEVAEEMGIKDITICEVNKLFNNGNLTKAIEEGASILFLINNNQNKKYVEMLDYVLANDLGVNYTIALAPKDIEAEKELLKLYCSLDESDGSKTWEEIENELVKKAARAKALELDTIVVEDCMDTKFNFAFDGSFKTSTQYKRMPIFPKYSLEMVPKNGAVNGYIGATANTYFDSEPVEELRLSIKKGKVVDFDATKGGTIAEKYLGQACDTEVTSIGLIDSSEMTYDKYGSYNNFVLDKERSPYVLLRSYNTLEDESKFIYVPVGSGLLKIYGINEKGKKLPLYEEEAFTKRLNPKRK